MHQNTEISCTQARPYYYEFVLGDTQDIAEPVREHIKLCSYCDSEIVRLGQVLAATDKNDDTTSSIFNKILELHFAFLDRPVTCTIAKAVLPSLADPRLRLTISTPITAHIDNCQQCRHDLEVIRGLELDRMQLYRLGLLFADNENHGSCDDMDPAILSIAGLQFAKITPEQIKHICTCTKCRTDLNNERETSFKSIKRTSVNLELSCSKVKSRDLFDYAIPYGFDDAQKIYQNTSNSLQTHITKCPKCLARIQRLQQTIFSILERPASGVITCARLNSSKVPAFGEDDIYLPIGTNVVNISQNQPETSHKISAVHFAKNLRHRIAAVNLKRLAAPLVAAAAVFIFVVAIFFMESSAKATTLEQLYNAIERIRNVCISSFEAKTNETLQDDWISRSLSVEILISKREHVLFDITNGTRTINDLGSNKIRKDTLSEVMRHRVENGFKQALVPYDKITDLPPGSQWTQVLDQQVSSLIPGTEVYDLTWQTDVHHRWRYYVDITTKMPKRIEVYFKTQWNSDFVLSHFKTFKYPEDSTVSSLIHDLFDSDKTLPQKESELYHNPAYKQEILSTVKNNH